MPPSTIVEAFSLSHVQILDGATAFADVTTGSNAWGDVYGVNDASLDPDTDSYDNEGDDVVRSTWNWLNKAEIAVQAGYVSFALIANMTGRTISSTGSGDSIVYGIDLWHEDDFNVPRKPMIIRVGAALVGGLGEAVLVLDVRRLVLRRVRALGRVRRGGGLSRWDHRVLLLLGGVGEVAPAAAHDGAVRVEADPADVVEVLDLLVGEPGAVGHAWSMEDDLGGATLRFTALYDANLADPLA